MWRFWLIFDFYYEGLQNLIKYMLYLEKIIIICYNNNVRVKELHPRANPNEVKQHEIIKTYFNCRT